MEHFCHFYQGSGRDRAWNKYVKAKKEATSKAELEIGRLFETKYGVNAMHEGAFPKDWAKSGGYPNGKYPHTYPELQSSKDVLDKKELKHSEFQRKLDLPNQGSNIKNHAFSHKCSSYCIRKKNLLSHIWSRIIPIWKSQGNTQGVMGKFWLSWK